MQKLFQFNESEIAVDTEDIYSGTTELSLLEKQVRKAIGLPVTKQLIYYTDKNSDSVVPILNYRVREFFPEWSIIEVTLTNGEIYVIHSSYLAEMQKPSFVADMARQAEAI